MTQPPRPAPEEQFLEDTRLFKETHPTLCWVLAHDRKTGKALKRCLRPLPCNYHQVGWG